MSTSYSELKAPWTSIRMTERGGDHFELSLWANGALTGNLVLRKGEISDAIHSLTGERAGTVVAPKEGQRLVIFKTPRTDCVVSEYAEIKSWTDIVNEFHQGH